MLKLKRKPALKLVPKVDPEFAALIAPLTAEERQQLEANLIAHGCRDALVTWRGLLIDGHNRLEICNRHGLAYDTAEIELPDRESAKLWIETNQLGRRNLSSDQRAAVAYRIMQRRVAISKKERAAKAGAAHGSSRILVVHAGHQVGGKTRQRERTAKEHNISTRKIRVIAQLAKTAPDIVDRIAAGTLTIKQAKDQLVEECRLAKRLAALKTNPKGCRIHTGDLSLLYRLIPDDSADLFLTDPPYQEDAIPLYGKLAELAERKLKPGCLCAVMCGQMHLDRVMSEMTKHLQYYWLCGVGQKTVVRSTRIVSRKVLSTFKPVLIFSKRPMAAPSSRQFFLDLVLGTHDKEHHWMGQGVEQFQYLIDHLTDPGALVVDPFCGGGTVPVACVATGRRYIATEIDRGVAAAARARVAATIARKG
jgi:16S rRNA G966 N2-methylase RsmD